jgi:hypothetical protein
MNRRAAGQARPHIRAIAAFVKRPASWSFGTTILVRVRPAFILAFERTADMRKAAIIKSLIALKFAE